MTIRERITDFVILAQHARTHADKVKLAHNEQNYIYTYHAGSAHTYLNQYCKALQDAGIEEPFTYELRWDATRRTWSKVAGLMREPRAKREERDKRSRENLRERGNNACEVFPSARNFIDHAVGLLDSPYWSYVFAGILPLCGRRTFEVGVQGTFWPDEHRRYYVHYTGQAKTRSEERMHAEYIIPVLAPADLVCTAIQRLRDLRVQSRGKIPFPTDAAAFSEGVANPLGKVTAKTYTPLFDGRKIAPHELRRLYAVYAFRIFRRQGQRFEYFLSEKLGHLEGSLGGAQFYKDYEPYLYQSDTSVNPEEFQQ